MSFAVTTGTSLVMSYFLYKLHTSTVRVILRHARTFRLIGSLAYHILIVYTSIGVADKPQGVPGFINVHPHGMLPESVLKPGLLVYLLVNPIGSASMVYVY